MVYGIIALLALLVDQFLKFWTVSNVALNTGIRPLIPGFLHITYIKNFGAAFGVMSSFGALRWILLILLIAFTALMVFAFIKGYFRTGLTKVSGALLLAGLLGNGIDRAIYGYVPDIFELELFKFPIFNLADVLVLIGGILFAVAILTGGLRRADEFDDYEEEEAPVRPARRREYDDEPAARRAPRTAEEAPVRRTAPRPAAPTTAAPSARGTAAPSPARQRAAGNGIPGTPPHTKRVIDENSVPVPVRPAARPAAAVQRTAETTRTAAEPVRRTAAPAAPVTRADLAAQNEATVRTVARPAAARPAAPKAAPTAAAPAPVRETPKAAPAPVKEAPKAASAEEFDLDSILAEFK